MRYKYFDLVMALFVTVLLVSNVASSAKIVDWGVSLAGLPLAFDAGTLLFPLSYIFGDVLTEVYGYRRSRRVIWTGFACLCADERDLLAGGPAAGGSDVVSEWGQAKYDAILGGVSTGAIIVASLVAYWGGEFSNSFVLAKNESSHPRAAGSGRAPSAARWWAKEWTPLPLSHSLHCSACRALRRPSGSH